MDRFIKLNDKEKNDAYRVASSKVGNLPEELIEKDFWVCWTLQELFDIEGLKDNLIFKGGTTLSKVYDVIQRFSEDIDLAIEKSFFGFVNERDPINAKSSRKSKELINEMSSACSNYVINDLLPLLNEKFKNKLKGDWKLEIDPSDNDKQTILFFYPKITSNKSTYIRPAVKIELGSRSEHFPSGVKVVIPYVQIILPDNMKDIHVKTKVLEVERTFWEKATILHSFAHAPEGKKISERQSRHYYDFYQLLKSTYKNSCIEKSDLLKVVATHKALFFSAAWARYDLAKKGTLRLLPKDEVSSTMEKDYKLMSEMFLTAAPSWSEILKEIESFEKEFN